MISASLIANGKWQMANSSGRRVLTASWFYSLLPATVSESHKMRVITMATKTNMLLGIFLFSWLASNLSCADADVSAVAPNKARYSSGLKISDVSDELKKMDPALAAGGALIHIVDPGSAAEQAGLKRGDIIVAVNGVAVSSAREFVAQFQSEQHPGLALQLNLLRLQGGFKPRQITLVRDLIKK